MIKCRPAANRNYKPARRTTVTWSGPIMSRDSRAVMRANESNFYFAIQQGQFAAKMTDGVRLRLFSRISELFHYRVGQIERRHQLCAGLLPDFNGIAYMIGMPMRNENEIDVFKCGNLPLRVFENRI